MLSAGWAALFVAVVARAIQNGDVGVIVTAGVSRLAELHPLPVEQQREIATLPDFATHHSACVCMR